MSWGDGDSPPREWQAPKPESDEKRKLGWIDEGCQQGVAWQQSQRGFKDWRQGLQVFSGVDANTSDMGFGSRLSGHRLKTNVRTITSGLSNIRPMWGWHAGKSFSTYATNLNKTSRALYLEGYWDQKIKDALQYAACVNTGFIRPVWRRDLQGRGNIDILVYGQPCVLPVQLPADGDYQRAYVVHLLEEIPIYEAHWKFPLFQDRLKPTSSRYWYDGDIRRSSMRNATNAGGWPVKREDSKLTDQLIPIRWSLINDCSINDTGKRMPMGEPGASWYYEVPYYGEEIRDGYDEHGNPQFRKANEQDAKLYPQRRLMISSQECVMYDGPGFNWHGELDLTPFCLDRYPWEPMGFSMVHDGWDLQRSIDTIDRMVMRKVVANADPSLKYDMNAVTKLEAEEYDPLEPGKRLGYDGQATENPISMALPPEAMRIHAEALEARKGYIEELDYIFQTRDVVELGKARALGKGMDQLEALLAANGPIIKDMSRGMEAGLGQVGRQVGWLVLQYMTTGRLMQWIGAENMSLSVFDYDPASIVPSHLPSERAHEMKEEDFESWQKSHPSQYTRMQRAKWFGKNVQFFLLPHSVHEFTQMTYRLVLLQLSQRGFPIAKATVMESCEVPDVEKPDGNTQQEQFYAEKEEEIQHAIRLQEILKASGLDPSMFGGGGKPNGRPPSGKAPPQMKHKGDGRPTVTESQ
jgi:hypothetical protein